MTLGPADPNFGREIIHKLQNCQEQMDRLLDRHVGGERHNTLQSGAKSTSPKAESIIREHQNGQRVIQEKTRRQLLRQQHKTSVPDAPTHGQ